MIELTESQMFDYIFCPAKYDIKYNRRIDIQEPISLPRLLSRVSKFFYTSLVNGKVPSINELKNKWDSISRQYPNFVDSKKNIAGWGMIVNLTQWAAKEQIMVVDVNTFYQLTVGSVSLKGNLETVLVRPDKKSELLITSFSDKVPDQIETDMKLKYTLDAAAFKVLTQKPLDGIRVHSVKSDKDIITTRSEPDFKRLDTTIRNVGRAIEGQVFYPREQNLCSTCTARQYCRYWYK